MSMPTQDRLPADPSRIRRAVAVTILVLLAGSAWRVAVGLVLVPRWEARAVVGSFPDAYPYLAATLLDRGVLGYGDVGATPTTVRGPAFPAWLATGMLLGLDGPRGIAWWSALPGVLGGGAIALLLARRHGALAGAMGGLIAVLHPLPAVASARAMADEFYGVLGFVGLACFAAAAASPAGRRGATQVVACGSALALQMLTRATGLLSLVAIVLESARSRRWRGGLISTLALIALLPPLAWSVRSSRLEGRPVFVHSLLGYNFWFGEAFHRLGPARAASDTRRLAMRSMAEECSMPELLDPGFWYVRLTPPQAAELDRCLVSRAGARILDDPPAFAARVGLGLFRFWFAADDPARSRQYVALVAPLLAAALLGAWSVHGRGGSSDPLGQSLVLLVVLHALAYAATWPMARLSVQVYPALAYLAGIGLARIAPRSWHGVGAVS